MRRPVATAALIALAMFWASCSGGSERKIVLNENVCAGVEFLRMRLGQDTKIILDNTQHSEQQDGISVLLSEFPAAFVGELPPDAQVGANFVTLRLSAPAGERDEVTIKPTLLGQFRGTCNINVATSNGGTGIEYELTFQIVEK